MITPFHSYILAVTISTIDMLLSVLTIPSLLLAITPVKPWPLAKYFNQLSINLYFSVLTIFSLFDIFIPDT